MGISNAGKDAIAGFLRGHRKDLEDSGFRNPLNSLGSSRVDTGFEFESSHAAEVAAALVSAEGRFKATAACCCGTDKGDSFSDRLRSVALTAESLESDVGMNLLKVGIGAVVWRDQDGREREAPLWLRSVRISGNEFVGEGPVEINEVFFARAAKAGLNLEVISDEGGLIDFNEVFEVSEAKNEASLFIAAGPLRIERKSVVVRDDKSGIFARFKKRLIVDVLATTKLALWKSLDVEARPEILSRGAVRLLAGEHLARTPLRLADANLHIVPADPAQDEVISAARRGESFVVQGPPGTGKSQVAVNVVANVLADGRRILVAADKTSAIEVVAARLAGAGISHRLLLGQITEGDDDAQAVLTTAAMAARFLPHDRVFDLLVVDEAGQMPLAEVID